MKRKVKATDVVAWVPRWPKEKWGSFWAQGYEPVWRDGTVGSPFGPERSGIRPDASKRKDLRKRIRMAIRKSQKYIASLQAAHALMAERKKNI